MQKILGILASLFGSGFIIERAKKIIRRRRLNPTAANTIRIMVRYLFTSSPDPSDEGELTIGDDIVGEGVSRVFIDGESICVDDMNVVDVLLPSLNNHKLKLIRQPFKNVKLLYGLI